MSWFTKAKEHDASKYEPEVLAVAIKEQMETCSGRGRAKELAIERLADDEYYESLRAKAISQDIAKTADWGRI